MSPIHQTYELSLTDRAGNSNRRSSPRATNVRAVVRQALADRALAAIEVRGRRAPGLRRADISPAGLMTGPIHGRPNHDQPAVVATPASRAVRASFRSVLAAATAYFGLVFAAGFALGVIRVLVAAP